MNTHFIKLENNIDKIIKNDADLFFQKIYIQKNYNFEKNKTLIFNVFSELKTRLDNVNDESDGRGIISDFVNNFYINHSIEIEKIIKTFLIEKLNNDRIDNTISLLGKYMNYTWQDSFDGYEIIPTILPFSPFNNDVIFYSILGYLSGQEKNDNAALITIVHEISHFILHDKINNNSDLQKIALPSLIYYLQEILTVVLLNQETIKKELTINSYVGNPDIDSLVVLYNNQEMKLTDFFSNLWNDSFENDLDGFLVVMIKTLNTILPELEKRHMLWSLHGFNLYKVESVFKEYTDPIIIDRY